MSSKTTKAASECLRVVSIIKCSTCIIVVPRSHCNRAVLYHFSLLPVSQRCTVYWLSVLLALSVISTDMFVIKLPVTACQRLHCHAVCDSYCSLQVITALLIIYDIISSQLLSSLKLSQNIPQQAQQAVYQLSSTQYSPTTVATTNIFCTATPLSGTSLQSKLRGIFRICYMMDRFTPSEAFFRALAHMTTISPVCKASVGRRI